MHGSDQDEIEYNKHTQNDVNNFVQIITRNRPEFEIEEDDDPKEIQELNDFIGRFPNFFDQVYVKTKRKNNKKITFDDLRLAINIGAVREIINYPISEKIELKDIKYLKMLQACAVCEVLDRGYGLQCDLRISDCRDSEDNEFLVQKVDEILLNSKKAFTAYWFPSQNLRSDLVNNVDDNKYFFVKFNSNNKLLIEITFKNEDKKNQIIPLSMCLAHRFIKQWYSYINLDKHEDKILQDRFGAIMQYLDYSLRSYSLFNKDENKTKFNDAADFVLKGIVEPYYDLLRMEIFGNADYAIKDVSYRYSILNLVRMYELCRDSHVTPTVAVMKYFNDQEYYLGNGLVTEEDMQNVLNKYKENFANKQKKSQNSSLHQSENDNSENSHNDNSDNENDEKENKSEFNSFLGLNQENSSVSHDLKDGVKKQTKKNNNNDITKPVVENMSSSPPQLNKKQSVKQQLTLKNHSVSGGTKSQPVNNKPAETNKSDKSNKVEDPLTQKFKEKSEDKKDVENKVQNVKKDKQNKKINNTRSKLNNEEQKNQTSNAYTYLFIALGVIVVSVIAFLIYRNFVSNVASSESLQNYAANLLSV